MPSTEDLLARIEALEARALAAEGTNLILNGFGDGAEIESLRQEIEKTHKVKVLYSPADMTTA